VSGDVTVIPFLTADPRLATVTLSDTTTPATGSASTPLVFKVVYTNSFNQAPQSVRFVTEGESSPCPAMGGGGISRLFITTAYAAEGDGCAMEVDTTASATLRDGDYTNGEQYILKQTFPTGNYAYHYEADDVRYPTFDDVTLGVTDGSASCVVDCNSNVLFLPGIMGSRIYWTDPSCVHINCENKLWIPNRNDDVEKLYMATGTSLLSQIYTKDDDILLEGTFLDERIYKSFADDMNSLVASGAINAWKPIAYDWRYGYDHLLAGGLNIDGKIYYDVPTSFPYILEELYTLAASSRTGRVTIVAHSNGGLLAKTLIQKLKDAGQADLIDNLILVASPQLGTPQAIGALLHGYDASGLKYYVGKSAQRKLAHDMPMTYNLLPSEKYLSTVSTPVIIFDEDVPVNAIWGDEINNTGEYLAYLLGGDNRPHPDFGELEDPAIANETLLTSALEWHANFDDWVAPTTTIVYQIAGWGKETVSGIRYSNDAWLSDFSWDYEPLMTEDGDGTVVVPSALGNDGQKYWVNLDSYNSDNADADHAKIFEVQQLRSLIKNIIRKEEITDPGQYISTTRPSAVNIEKRLRYFLHSPLTLELYDALGRHVGISTTTGQVEEQIPGASYGEFGEVKYISISASASTTLVMHGEGVGRFTLNVQEVTGGVVTATTTFANIPVSTSTLVTMSVPENSILSTLPGLAIDQDGNGTIDTYASPGTALVPDITPPELQVSFDTSTRQLQFMGLDMGSISVLVNATSVTVTDASDNTLRIPFLSRKEKNRRALLSFNTLVYNGSTIAIATTTVKYKWKTDASGKFTMFAAYIKTGSTTLEAHYRPKKNHTIIMSKPADFDDSDSDDECDNRPVRTKLQGLVIPGVQTSSGSMNIIY
jgi:pimeloyl-ACP methyl ester carboxylesterase